MGETEDFVKNWTFARYGKDANDGINTIFQELSKTVWSQGLKIKKKLKI